MFDAFIDGDIYSAIADRHRFSTVDNQLWTMGEIVTAFAGSGLKIESLIENPRDECESLPGDFVLLGTK